MTLEKFIEWKESEGIEQNANKDIVDIVLIWSRYEPLFTKY